MCYVLILLNLFDFIYKIWDLIILYSIWVWGFIDSIWSCVNIWVNLLFMLFNKIIFSYFIILIGVSLYDVECD